MAVRKPLVLVTGSLQELPAGDRLPGGTDATVTGTAPVLSPDTADVLLWTLAANSAPTFGTFASGQGFALLLTAGAFTVTYPAGIVWLTPDNLAPAPKTTGVSGLYFYKIGTTVYGGGR